ncbi:MAG: HAMP domain-containing protein [Actinobacteria bacterium]|nr:HAMP domain-containing protein [Actinomycetota bacterium]
MKLRTQFFVGAGILVVVLVALAVVAITTGIRVSHVRNQHDITASIEQHANDLSYVSNNYLLYRERTQKLEWDSLFASLSADLGRLAPSGPEEASLISNLRANSARLRQVFADVVSLGESPAGATGVEYRTSLQISWSRMEVQNRQIVSGASRLERLLEVREDRAVQMSSITIYGLVAVACLLLLAGYFFSYRRTIAGILALQAGTEIVGTGDLDQVIPEDGNDELGALSRAFNKMTRDLKSVAYRYESQRSIAMKLSRPFWTYRDRPAASSSATCIAQQHLTRQSAAISTTSSK